MLCVSNNICYTYSLRVGRMPPFRRLIFWGYNTVLAIIGSRFHIVCTFASLGQRKIYKSQETCSKSDSGAGNARKVLLRDIKRTKDCNDSVVCFMNDDTNK